MSDQPTGCPSELRQALDSPVPSVRTPFTSSGEVDWDGVRAQVDFLIAGNAKFLMLTWGDSLHSLLTDDEVAELAKVVVRHTAGRAKVIAADNAWATGKAVAYAEYTREIGADLLMLLPPDWASSTTPDTLVDHFNAVGQHMPLMLVTAFFNQGDRSDGFGKDVVRALYEKVPSMVAIKDDVLGDFGNWLCRFAHDRWAMVSGGLMKNHLAQVPYGVDGYLCAFMSFQPEIAWQYWKAIQACDLKEAGRIVCDVETPVWEHFESYTGGFNAVMHGIFQLKGICSGYLRPPYHTLPDEQLERLGAFLKAKGLM